MLPVTISDVKFILRCEIARKTASGNFDSAAAIEMALEAATEHWDEYGYKDDFVIYRRKDEKKELKKKRNMKLIIEVPIEEYNSYKVLFDSGMGSAAIRRILNGKPYEEGAEE